jgi:hypothetical protein
MYKCFYLDVVYVAMAIHVSCKCMFQTFYLFQMYVTDILSRCFSGYTHMLQASKHNVSSVPDICCKYVYLDVVVSIHICCKCMFINISPVSDLCCRSASCCNISRRRKRTYAETVPTCAASEAGVSGPHLHVHAAACGRCGMRGRPCRRNSCMRGRRPGAIPFLEHINFCVGTMHVEKKLLPLTQLHAVD